MSFVPVTKMSQGNEGLDMPFGCGWRCRVWYTVDSDGGIRKLQVQLEFV